MGGPDSKEDTNKLKKLHKEKAFTNGFKHEVEQNNHITNNNQNNSKSSNHHDYKKDEKSKKTLPEKIFVARNSIITDITENPHIKILKTLALSSLFVLFLHTLVYDYLDTGSINIGFRLITVGFGKFDCVMFIWMCMQIIALLPYFMLQRWASLRNNSDTNIKYLRTFDRLYLGLFVVFQITFLAFGTAAIYKFDLPVVSRMIVILETLRFIMKNHSYVRSVAARILIKKTTSTVNSLPMFSNYFYFLFAPTMIYRDVYPRSDSVNWKRVLNHLLNMLLATIFSSYLLERYFLTYWRSFGQDVETMELKEFVNLTFASMLPSLLFYISGFFILLHCWLNAFAEMLRFADRQFYKDWWTQSNYGAFYRTWNIVVHDWLYTYIYKDVYELLGKKWIAMLCVFETSALVHEFILVVTFKFFYPLLFILFGLLSVVFVYTTKNAGPLVGNMSIWVPLFIGNGLLFVGYGTEYFARFNCPQVIENNFVDTIVPRSWYCHNVVLG